MEKIDQINAILEKLQKFVEGHSDQAFSLVIQATQYHGATELVLSSIYLCVGIAVLMIGLSFVRKALLYEGNEDKIVTSLAVATAFGAIALIPMLAGIAGTLSTTNWMEALSPTQAAVLTLIKTIK